MRTLSSETDIFSDDAKAMAEVSPAPLWEQTALRAWGKATLRSLTVWVKCGREWVLSGPENVLKRLRNVW